MTFSTEKGETMANRDIPERVLSETNDKKENCPTFYSDFYFLFFFIVIFFSLESQSLMHQCTLARRVAPDRGPIL